MFFFFTLTASFVVIIYLVFRRFPQVFRALPFAFSPPRGSILPTFDSSTSIQPVNFKRRLNASFRSIVNALYTRGGYQATSSTDASAALSFADAYASGLTSNHFNLEDNLEGDARQGLPEEEMRDIQRIMAEHRVGFDEARLIKVKRMFRAMGIGEDGMPLDNRSVTFSGIPKKILNDTTSQPQARFDQSSSNASPSFPSSSQLPTSTPFKSNTRVSPLNSIAHPQPQRTDLPAAPLPLYSASSAQKLSSSIRYSRTPSPVRQFIPTDQDDTAPGRRSLDSQTRDATIDRKNPHQLLDWDDNVSDEILVDKSSTTPNRGQGKYY